MKKLFTLVSLSITLLFGFQANAQYCGSSQVTTSACGLPPQNPNFRGFGSLDSIPCIQKGVSTDLIIPFVNYDQFTAQGNHVNIKKLRIDTISNLPCGLCWSTNKATNEFLADEFGCFKIHGTTNDPAGEYKMHLILSVATVDTNSYSIVHINANAGGVYLYLRVQANGSACVSVDTSSLGLTATCITGINEVSTATVHSLSIQPNPMSAEAKVTFTSETNGDQQIRITNVVGSEVYNAAISAKMGINETTISRNNLPAGIYILSVGNASGMISRKFVIAE